MPKRIAGIAVVLAIALGYLFGYQTTYNTVVVTNGGQFVNARLNDNVYIDMAVSPPALKARRATLGVHPVEQADGTWLIPTTVTMGSGIAVHAAGLRMDLDVDYKIDSANPRRIIPWRDGVQTVWHYTEPPSPYRVVVDVFP